MSLLLSISAVFPIFFYLLAGAALRRGGRLSDVTMNQVNKIVYSYCFPLICSPTYTAPTSERCSTQASLLP